jgi:predicted nucleic acid-binding protein
VRRETLICDTSFVSYFLCQQERPDRYPHWSPGDIARIKAALLAISIVTIAELRAGYADAGWGSRRVAEIEREWAGYLPLLLDDPHLNAWVQLWVAAKARGIAISDNDLWIAATAAGLGQTLVTCDRDHVRLAPDMPVEVVFFAPPV